MMIQHMVTGVKFWERNAAVYDKGVDYILGNNLRLIVLDKLAREQHLGRTVEFGCGTGFFTPLLAQLSESVAATDISEKMLDLTRERIKGLPAVAVLIQDCEKTSFPPASFDTAFLGLTFQLVNGPVAVAEMQRILKPGGKLILAMPTMEDLRLSDKLRCVMRNCRTYGTIRPPGTKLYTHLTLPPIIARGIQDTCC